MKIIKESIWIIITQLSALVASVLTTKILTSKLDIGDYGYFSLALTVAGLFQLVFINPLEQASLRFYAESIKQGISSLFSKAIYQLTIKLTVIMLAIASILYVLYFKENLSPFIYGGALILALLNGIVAILKSKLNSNRHRKQVAIGTLINQISKVSLLIILASYFHIANWSAIWLFAFCCLLSIFYMYQFIRKSANFPKESIISYNNKDIIKYIKPFFIWNVFIWIAVNSDRWVLQEVIGPQDVGFYSFLFQITFLPAQLISAFTMNLTMPILFSKTSEEQHKKGMFYTLLFFVISSVFVGSLITVFSSEFIVLLSHNKYLVVEKYIPLMFLASIIFEASQVMSIKFLTQKRPEKLILPKVLPALAGLCFQLYMIPKFGLIGAVYSRIVISSLYLILIVFSGRKQNKI